jgi:LmbE family N-acetylglucosaminyl deacetylase
MNKRIYVIAPHPDDESLACGGTIAQSLHAHIEVIIIVVSLGEKSHSQQSLDIELRESDLKSTRKKECEQACEILGVKKEHIHFLNFPDGAIDSYENELIEQFKKLLIIDENVETEVYFPHLLDLHLDHRIVSKMVFQWHKSVVSKPTLYMYFVYPYQLTLSLSKTLIKRDISDVIDLKRKAIETYRSQFSNYFEGQKNPVLSAGFKKEKISSLEEQFFIL